MRYAAALETATAHPFATALRQPRLRLVFTSRRITT